MLNSLDRALASRAARQHGIFSLADAQNIGLTNDQIDERVNNSWVRLYEGVYRHAGAPATWRGCLLAATMAPTPPVAISHRAAAALYGLPYGVDDRVELTTQR